MPNGHVQFYSIGGTLEIRANGNIVIGTLDDGILSVSRTVEVGDYLPDSSIGNYTLRNNGGEIEFSF